MKKIIEILKEYFEIIYLVLIIFLLSGILYLVIISKNSNKKQETNIEEKSNKVASVESITDKISNNIKVDIKGAIKNPGVYEMNTNDNVSDLIEKAGGLTKKATTSNINLSRMLEDQMVIKISTTDEIKKNSVNPKISECMCKEVIIDKCKENSITKINGDNYNAVITDANNETSSTVPINNADTNNAESNSKLININTASVNELTTLSGIGESKANSIIEYRNTNGVFKSIDEIKNISGIGDSLFEKIKANITI